jgi:hypothetical protein
MKILPTRSRKRESKGSALVIVLAFVVLVTGITVAYLSRTTTDRQLAQSSHNDTSGDLLARSALDIVVSDFKQEIVSGQPVSPTNIQPARYGDDPAIANLVRRSFSGDPTGRTSNVPSTALSANGRSISTARWNSHYLIPRRPPVPPETWNTIYSDPVTSFTAPNWVLVTAKGPNAAPLPDAVIGRYAFAVYDEGGLLDMNLAGYPAWSGTVNPNPAPSPTPWLTNVGRKGIMTFADLTALPAAPSTTLPQNQIDNIVGWRNWNTTQQPGGASFGSPNFSSGNMHNRQDTFGSYALDFGDPPYSSPCPVFPFTTVDTSNAPSANRTDQGVMTRQELLKLRSSLGFSQNVLQYLGTFSRERNQPARDWYHLGTKLPDRFDISMLSLVKPNPPGTPTQRGKGKGRQRGRFRGDAASILNLMGLRWVAGTGADPHQVTYWGHWLYVGTPGVPSNDNPHIPALRGGRNDFFQILDYALTQANADNEDTANAQDIISLGATLLDQNDGNNNGDPPDDLDPRTSTPITIIQTGNLNGQFVLGWENGQASAATDIDPTNPHNPYNWIIDPATGTTKQRPSFTPIVLNHPFTTVGELGYGLRPEYATNRFQRLNFNGAPATSNATLLDFFTYNPVDHDYPRLGIANLNTKNEPVIAAILQGALKKDIDAPPPLPNPFPSVAPTEATAAAHAIVSGASGTSAQPVLTRADIGRLTAVAASAISTVGFAPGEETEKVPEAITRALSELTQARTWNLFIDMIAQTGRYAPGTVNVTDANKFIVEGEKRYWLHIALGRDLVSGQVDVLGTQLEEVVE